MTQALDIVNTVKKVISQNSNGHTAKDEQNHSTSGEEKANNVKIGTATLLAGAALAHRLLHHKHDDANDIDDDRFDPLDDEFDDLYDHDFYDDLDTQDYEDSNYEFERAAYEEEQAAYDDFIASLDMADD